MYYKNINGIYVGQADLTISDVGCHCPEFFMGYNLLITTLDSGDIDSSSLWLKEGLYAKYEIELFEHYAIIPEKHFKDVFADGKIFYHFDTIYFVDYIKEMNVTISMPFTSDGIFFSKEVPSEFWEHFLGLKAVRFLSDGCGLNFACESKKLVNRLAHVERKLN